MSSGLTREGELVFEAINFGIEAIALVLARR